MAVLKLPIDALSSNYRIGVSLDDVPYIMDIRWNGRDEAWYMDLYDVTEDPIQLGNKMVLGAALLARCTDPRKPTGLLTLSDLSNEGVDATIDDLGTRVVVFYYTEDELEV